MEKARIKIRATKYKWWKMTYRNYIQIGSLACLILKKFPKLAEKIWAADGKCIEIEITMKEVD